MTTAPTTAPFDTGVLDRLMAEADLDAVLVTSRHNARYLLGGYRFFFFAHMDAIGSSRYLPVVLYVRGRPEQTAYFANTMEKFEVENGAIWCPHVTAAGWNSAEAIAGAVRFIRDQSIAIRRLGVERPFLPVDSHDQLARDLPGIEFAEAGDVLHELRARKTPRELDLMTRSADAVSEAMIATFGRLRDGMTKRQIVDILREEETQRGLEFEYCLITAGTSLNRAPSDQALRRGDIVSLDSGANFEGYIGDICRMGILGHPDDELEEMLQFVDGVQQAARAASKPGATGRDIYRAAEQAMKQGPYGNAVDFVAHGMGLVSHESPQLTSSGDVRYPGYYEDNLLQAGMVLSIETTLRDRGRGFVKLEDAVYLTEDGNCAIGDIGRGWNRIGGNAGGE